MYFKILLLICMFIRLSFKGDNIDKCNKRSTDILNEIDNLVDRKELKWTEIRKKLRFIECKEDGNTVDPPKEDNNYLEMINCEPVNNNLTKLLLANFSVDSYLEYLEIDMYKSKCRK